MNILIAVSYHYYWCQSCKYVYIEYVNKWFVV